MRVYVIVFVAVVALLLGGCSWQIDPALALQPPAEKLRDVGQVEIDQAQVQGFMEGCLALIFYTTPQHELPPHDKAVQLCQGVYELHKSIPQADPAVAPMPVMPPPVICTGQCI